MLEGRYKLSRSPAFYSFFHDTLSTHTHTHTYAHSKLTLKPLRDTGKPPQCHVSVSLVFFFFLHGRISLASRYILSRTNLCLTRALSKQLPALFYIFIAYTGTCAERNLQLRNLTTWFAYASIFSPLLFRPFLATFSRQISLLVSSFLKKKNINNNLIGLLILFAKSLNADW